LVIGSNEPEKKPTRVILQALARLGGGDKRSCASRAPKKLALSGAPVRSKSRANQPAPR
jgi:hypothetical protein